MRGDYFLRLVFWLGALIVLIGIVMFAWKMEREGVNDAMMSRFDAPPAEGYEYWEAAEWKSRTRGMIIGGSIFCALAFLILRGIYRTSKAALGNRKAGD